VPATNRNHSLCCSSLHNNRIKHIVAAGAGGPNASFKKEQLLHTRTAILFSAIFMTVMATGSSAQDPGSDEDANKQSRVCLTHMISDATGDCRSAFMQAFTALAQKCGNDKALNEASIRSVNAYMSACGCSSECRQ
jgi:hypothetical protein